MSIRKYGIKPKDNKCWIFKMPYIDDDGVKKVYVSERFKTKGEAKEAEHLFLASLMENKIEKNELKVGESK